MLMIMILSFIVIIIMSTILILRNITIVGEVKGDAVTIGGGLRASNLAIVFRVGVPAVQDMYCVQRCVRVKLGAQRLRYRWDRRIAMWARGMRDGKGVGSMHADAFFGREQHLAVRFGAKLVFRSRSW